MGRFRRGFCSPCGFRYVIGGRIGAGIGNRVTHPDQVGTGREYTFVWIDMKSRLFPFTSGRKGVFDILRVDRTRFHPSEHRWLGT